jgi:hypothetical protein
MRIQGKANGNHGTSLYLHIDKRKLQNNEQYKERTLGIGLLKSNNSSMGTSFFFPPLAFFSDPFFVPVVAPPLFSVVVVAVASTATTLVVAPASSADMMLSQTIRVQLFWKSQIWNAKAIAKINHCPRMVRDSVRC